MSTDTMTTQADLYMRRYSGEFQKAFQDEFVGWKLATKNSKEFAGGQETIGIQVQRTSGVGMRAETQALPVPNGPLGVQAVVSLARMFHVFQVSHDAVERSVGKGAAFRELLGWEVEAGFDRMMKLGNIYFYGDGRGALCTVATGGGGSLGATVGNTLQCTVDTTRYLEPGDLVTVWTTVSGATIVANGGQLPNAGTTPKDETVQISSVDSTTLVTLKRIAGTGTDGAACTVAASNVFRLYGDSTTDATTRTDNVFSGMGLFADDGTLSTNFQGLSRSTYTRLKGQLIALTGTPDLTRDYLYRLNDKIRRNSPYKGANVALWDYTLRREYLNLIQPDIRFAPVKDTDAGYNADGDEMGLTVGAKKWRLIEDSDVPFGTVFAFPIEALEYYELSAMQLDNSTGSTLKQALPYGASAGTGDIFYGYARCKGNFATECPPAFGKITGLNYTAE